MMDTVLTIGLLLKVAGVGAGILLLVLGAIMVFAAGMASSPTETSRRVEHRGCTFLIVGLGILCASIYWAFFA